MNGGQTNLKTFRELTVFGESEVLESLISGIESRLEDGWFRRWEYEEKLRRFSRERQFCFARRANAEHPDVALLTSIDGRRLIVSNVVPNGHELSVAQYNSVLTEFYLRFLHPAALEVGLPVELSSDERTIGEVFGWTGAELLRRFSACPNKSLAHPRDRERWLEFLLYVNLHRRSNRDCDSALLAQFLIKDGWPADKARRLVSEYEFAGELLRALERSAFPAQCRQPIHYRAISPSRTLRLIPKQQNKLR